MITNKDHRAINLAAKMMKCSSHHRYRISAVLIKGGRVISVGINKLSAPKSYVKQYRDNLALHAEVDALIGIDKKIARNATLYVCGETSNFNSINCKPCPSCEMFAKVMGIKRIVYKNRDKIEEIRDIKANSHARRNRT